MRLRFAKVTAATLAGIYALAGVARGDGETLSDSGVERPPYERILDASAAAARASDGWATVIDYGRSSEGRALRALRLAAPGQTPRAARPAVLITGATHGNEYLNIEDRLGPWLLAHRDDRAGVARFFAAGGVLLIVPVVNPDGYAAGTRENARGADLNRDFDVLPLGETHFHESESLALARWLDAELAAERLQLLVTVDYHCCDGALLYPWSHADQALPAADQARFEKIAALMRRDVDAGYNAGNTAQILGYTARGTSKDYYYARYHALAFTFEGAYKEEPAKFARHAAWWADVLGTLAP
jgi:hypothetical protein